MPTVNELLKLANQVKVEVTVTETKPQEEQSEREKLRESVHSIRSKLRAIIKEREGLQERLKATIRCGFGTAVVRKYNHSIMRSNSKELSSLYLIMNFFRRGTQCRDAELAENEFNRIFKKNQAFRNEFWTCWNKKFQS